MAKLLRGAAVAGGEGTVAGIGLGGGISVIRMRRPAKPSQRPLEGDAGCVEAADRLSAYTPPIDMEGEAWVRFWP